MSCSAPHSQPHWEHYPTVNQLTTEFIFQNNWDTFTRQILETISFTVCFFLYDINVAEFYWLVLLRPAIPSSSQNSLKWTWNPFPSLQFTLTCRPIVTLIKNGAGFMQWQIIFLKLRTLPALFFFLIVHLFNCL